MPTALILMAVSAVFLVASSPASAEDVEVEEDLVQEFRDLFSEFLRRPSASLSDRTSKHIRDTSKGNRKQSSGKFKHEAMKDEPRSDDRPKLSPLYQCNHFNPDSRMCVNVRQLGTTLTIGVRVEGGANERHPIHWYRVFGVRGHQPFSFVKFTRESVPWNVNIGGDNNELRISPITDTDFSYNLFLATLDKASPEMKSARGNLELMLFAIEPISIDMGALYHGEEITVNVRSHMELPPRSVRYEWARVGADFGVAHNLPSNMKLSRDGSALLIKEHRSSGDLTLTCAVYSNRNVTLARRNFFLRKIVPSPHGPRLGIGSELNLVRKRRFLDQFYSAGSNWKSKRDVPSREDDGPEEALAEPTFPPDQFSEIAAFEPSTPQFSAVDKSEETVLNFYGTTPTAEENGFGPPETEPAPPPKRPDQEPRRPEMLDELIEVANHVAEDRPPAYSTVRTVSEERASFEDRESTAIADCERNEDCGINAACIRLEGSKKFCRCRSHYRGNGLFCWLF